MSASRHAPASRLLASISSMEYVEGETLRKRLTDGPLKISLLDSWRRDGREGPTPRLTTLPDSP